MKRTLILTILFLLAAPAVVFAPPSVPGVRYVRVAPTGSCSQSPPVQVLNSSGDIYTCDNGTWTDKTTGTGSGTVSGQANNAIPKGTGPTSLGAQSSCTDNGTTFACTEPISAPTLAAGTTTPTTIGSSGVLLNGVPALQSQTSLNNYYSGGAGNLTGTGYSNTANGAYALNANTTGYNNTANGYQAGQYIADGVTYPDP